MKLKKSNLKIIDSLKEKQILEPQIWTSSKKINEEVRLKLLKISKNFFDDLNVNKDCLVDIQFTGSLASYSWSKYSDIDLHLILDYNKLSSDINIVENYFKAIKNLWNNNHNILIYNYEVEIYIENLNSQHFSNGLYSLLKNKWLKLPSKKDFRHFNDFDVLTKVNLWTKIINTEVYEQFAIKDWRSAYNNSNKILNKLKKLRQCGLEKRGQYSVENLAYKVLRRNKNLEKINKILNMSYDKMHTLK
jgi:hypothetical protein